MIKRFFLLALCSSLLTLFAVAPVHAAPAGAIGDDFIYIVEPGDNLSQLANLYTTSSQAWRHLQTRNQIDNELALPIGKQLKIPFSMIPVVATTAELVHTQGPVWVNDQPVRPTQPLKSGDVIRTGTHGFATLRLEDQTTLSLPNNSQLAIQHLNAFERAHLTDAILELQAGSVESRVAPDNAGVGRFEIHTPVSVTGVRGTDLRIHTEAGMATTELLSGKAHFNTATQSYQNLSASHGVSIKPDGSSHVTPLLAAPTLGGVEHGPQGWYTTLQPVPKADHYVVQISLDAAGTQVVKRYEVPADEQTILLSSSGAGEHFAFIRAVDETGLMGMNAQLAFAGQLTLSATDGSTVSSGFGPPVLLTQY